MTAIVAVINTLARVCVLIMSSFIFEIQCVSYLVLASESFQEEQETLARVSNLDISKTSSRFEFFIHGFTIWLSTQLLSRDVTVTTGTIRRIPWQRPAAATIARRLWLHIFIIRGK